MLRKSIHNLNDTFEKKKKNNKGKCKSMRFANIFYLLEQLTANTNNMA